MKKLLFPVVVMATIAFSVSTVSCGPAEDDTTDTNNVDTGTTMNIIPNDDMVAIPSPNDIFTFMKSLGPEHGDGSLLNPIENEKNYTSKKAQSLNLGVYSADFLYASTFKVEDKVLGYFGTCMRMGNTLQIATGLSEADKERINKNAGIADSLVKVGNDLYVATFNNLEAGGRGTELSLMLAGGFIEAVYLSCNMVKDFSKDKAIADQVADQSHSLDNCIEFMSKNESNEDVASVLVQLRDLKKLFDAVSTTAKEAPEQKEGQRMIIGGGTKKDITKEQFEAIKSKVEEIRKGFIEAQ